MNTIKKIFKTLLMILIITVFTYAVMAVITNFSLNYKLPDYTFSLSLLSVFDINTDIFHFFIGFIILNIIWISAAIIIWLITKLIHYKI